MLDIQYHLGALATVPDALSRRPDYVATEPPLQGSVASLVMEPSFLQSVSSHTFTAADQEMCKLVQLARGASDDFCVVHHSSVEVLVHTTAGID